MRREKGRETGLWKTVTAPCFSSSLTAESTNDCMITIIIDDFIGGYHEY